MKSKLKKVSIALAGIMSAVAIASVVPAGTVGTLGSVATVAHAETTTVTWSSSQENLNTGGVSVGTDIQHNFDEGDPEEGEPDKWEWRIAYNNAGGTFTTSLGNFTKIEIAGGFISGFSGSGWSGRTWTGKASSVPFSGYVTDDQGGAPFTITFTIESVEPATATYANVADYPAQFEGDTPASAWSVTVTPGSDTIEKIDVKVNGQSSNEGAWNGMNITGGTVVFGVAVNLAADVVKSVTAVVNDNDVDTTKVIKSVVEIL